ncbi:MAG: hypothetical protein EOO27_44810 [Comamonadaceae bacterium]|nr:MAG: hypothetical protein EOO27_44810 [Comamonadaceae bacterium]
MSISTAGSRQAALSLHAMSDHDRTWVLGALKPDQRARLQTLLAELRELGIPSDPAPAATTGPVSGGKDAMADTVPQLDMLNPRDVQILSEILRREPPAMVANVLWIREWAWHSAFMAQLSGAQRVRIHDALRQLQRDNQTERSAWLQSTILKKLTDCLAVRREAIACNETVAEPAVYKRLLRRWRHKLVRGARR